MNELKIVLKDKFAFIPKKVKDHKDNLKWIWMRKYTEILVDGEKVWKNVNGCMIYKPDIVSHGYYLPVIGHSERVKKTILENVKDRMKGAEAPAPKPKPQHSSYEIVLTSEEYYNKLVELDDIRDDTVYKIHRQNGPIQIIYVPTERAIYNIFGADPGDLILEEIGIKLYKVYKVDMVKGKDKQIMHITYQYMSDGSRDSILF